MRERVGDGDGVEESATLVPQAVAPGEISKLGALFEFSTTTSSPIERQTLQRMRYV